MALVSSVACGDTNNHYYTSGGEEEASNNPCDSPVYGKHLWEISGCKNAFSMGEDCSVGISGEVDDKNAGNYHGLEMALDEYGSFVLDPHFRFNPEYQNINDMLDKHGGYVIQSDSCRADHPDDCALIPLGIPFPGEKQCEASEYYAEK